MQETTGPTIHDIVTTNAGPFNGTLQISTDGFTNGASDSEGKNWGIIHETFTNSTSTAATDGATYLFGGSGPLTGISGDKAVYFTNLNGQLNNAQIAMGTGGTGAYEAQLDASVFSVEAWLNVPTYPIGWTSNTYQVPVCGFCQGGTSDGWFMALNTDSSGSSGAMFVGMGVGTAATFANEGPSAQVFSGKWVYVVQEQNAAGYTVVYTNGTLLLSNAVGYKPLSNHSSGEVPLMIGSLGAYYFGGSAFSGYTRSEFLDGGVSHVAYYNSALSAGRVSAHYQAGYAVVILPPPTPTLSIQKTGADVTVSWTNGFLLESTNVRGPWIVPPTNETSPQVIQTTNAQLFFLASSQPIIGPVTNPPSINTQPASLTNYVTATATFTVAAAGTAPLSYQWQVQSNGSYANLSAGGQFSGVTNATLTISSLTTNNTTNYDVVVTNSSGSVTSAVATLTVLGGSPSITTQPTSQTNNIGQTATFTVTVAGLAPLSYQWQVQSNGVYGNLSAGGQFSSVTNATLTISGLTLTNATNYEVVVTNLYGSVTSTVATLTIQTNSTALTAYQTVIIADAPTSFWPLNETNGNVIHDIVGPNNGTAGASGLTYGGPGILYSNGVTSDTAIYFNPTSSGYISVPYNADLNTSIFSVEAWLNMPIFPANAHSANENPVGFCNGIAAYGWTFDIQVANAANPSLYAWSGKGGAWNAADTGIAIQGKWTYYTMTFNGTTLLAYTNGVLAASTAVTNYDMVVSGNALYMGDYNDGGTSPDANRYYQGGMEDVAVYGYTLTPAQVAAHYFYGTNSSATFITTPPVSQTNYVGLTATFNVNAGGFPPLSYQWLVETNGSYVNLNTGGQYSGVTNSSLTISSLVLGNATNYEVVVTNGYGSITSSPATLTVLNDTAPSIVTQPASQTNHSGLNATFNVNATGYPPLYYHWRVEANGAYANLNAGGQFSGTTNATLTISTLVATNATNYDVVVSNAFGSVTSSAAALTVTTNTFNGTIKLMCIGDSITDLDPCDWRPDLANQLTDAGYNYLMVGRNQGTACPTSPVNQNHHEGYSGDTSSDILSLLPGAMAANVPDIAMVHIGANDLSGNYANQTLSNLAVIIRILQASNRNMTIVVSQIIPCELCPSIWEYDYLIPTINSNMSTATSKVVTADVFDNFDCNVYFDGGPGPHPNAAGGQFMCDVYYPIVTSILNGVIPTRPPLPPAFPGPSGYVLCSFANNGAFVVNFPTTTTIAWGVPPQYGGGPTNINGTYTGTPGGNGVYDYVSNVHGSYEFNNNIGDPDPGLEKFGYCAAPGIGVPGVPETAP